VEGGTTLLAFWGVLAAGTDPNESKLARCPPSMSGRRLCSRVKFLWCGWPALIACAASIRDVVVHEIESAYAFVRVGDFRRRFFELAVSVVIRGGGSDHWMAGGSSAESAQFLRAAEVCVIRNTCAQSRFLGAWRGSRRAIKVEGAEVHMLRR